MPIKKKSISKKRVAKKKSPSNHMPTKKKSVGNKMLTEKKTVSKEDKLEEAIADYTATGLTLTGRSKRTAQLKKPKQFNWERFTIWFIVVIFLFGIPLIVYLIYYWTKQDETITSSLDNHGHVLVNGMEKSG